jgi:small acid-soluble spore protein F (minor alpha/beta-type SASP)
MNLTMNKKHYTRENTLCVRKGGKHMGLTKDFNGLNKKPRKAEDAREIQLRRMKYEIAEELGLIDKIRNHGWTGLTAAECGMIGGKLGARLRAKSNKACPASRI